MTAERESSTGVLEGLEGLKAVLACVQEHRTEAETQLKAAQSRVTELAAMEEGLRSAISAVRKYGPDGKDWP